MSDTREQEPTVSLNVNLFCVHWVFVLRLRRFPSSDPVGACHAQPSAQAARNDVFEYGFWMDLEQHVDHASHLSY